MRQENIELYQILKNRLLSNDKHELLLNAKDNEQLIEFVELYLNDNGVKTQEYSLVNNYGFTANIGEERIDFRHVLNVYGCDTDYIAVNGRTVNSIERLLEIIKDCIAIN